jgi:peroxidase
VAADVALNSPPPGANITDIIALFATKFNLTAKDVAVLSGIYVSLLPARPSSCIRRN